MDLIEKLKEQIDFLQTSCKLYDQGKTAEAIRIAQTLRILLHNTKKSTSLFSLLNINSLYSTAPSGIPAPGKSNIIGLVKFATKLSPDTLDGKFEPLCYESTGIAIENKPIEIQRYSPKKDWWKNEIIFYFDKLIFTRQKLVLLTANKDGGAHVDPEIDVEYESLKKSEFKMEIDLVTGKKLKCTFEHIHLPALRQIGHEILNSKNVLEASG